MAIQKVKVSLFDRGGVLRNAYFYFTKNENYTAETPRQFVEQNQHFIGTKAESIEELEEFATEAEAEADVDAHTGANTDGAMYAWPPAVIA